eukprot:Hpha_TRINITY_DN16528_c1_g1::TRINITY_DN16528_c1_g1_i1::g.137256::m.137256
MQTMMARALQSRAVTAQVRMAGVRVRKAALRGLVAQGKAEDKKVSAAEKAFNAAQERADTLKKTEAAQAASKATKLKKAAALKAAKAVVREKRAALVAAKKAATPARAAAAKAQRRLDRRAGAKSAGPTMAWGVFLSEQMKGQKLDKTGNAVRAAAANWKSLSAEEKAPYKAQAEKNKGTIVNKGETKRAASPYNQHFREHFPGAYKKAVAAGLDRKAAFVAASKEVVGLWKVR